MERNGIVGCNLAGSSPVLFVELQGHGGFGLYI